MPIPSERFEPREDTRWLSKSFVLVLIVQAFFSLGWSVFFLLPKFFTQRFGLSGGAILSLTAVASVGALLAVPFIGHGLDRFGRRPFVTLGSAMVAVAALGFTQVDRIGPLVYAMLLLEGVGFVVAWNAAATLVADLAPPSRVGRVIGVFGAANLSMNAVAPWGGEELASAYGWNAPFLAAAASCAVAIFLSAALPSGRAAARPTTMSSHRAVLDPAILRVFAGASLFAVSFTAVFSLHAPFADRFGITEVSDFFLGFTVAALSTRLLLGGLVDRHGARIVSAIAMAAYAAAPISLWILGPTRLVVVGAILGACHGVLFPAVMALAVERSDRSSRGKAMAMVHGAFNLGSIATGLLLGAAADRFGYGAAFVCASAATLLGAAVTAVRPAAPMTTPLAMGEAAESARPGAPQLP